MENFSSSIALMAWGIPSLEVLYATRKLLSNVSCAKHRRRQDITWLLPVLWGFIPLQSAILVCVPFPLPIRDLLSMGKGMIQRKVKHVGMPRGKFLVIWLSIVN